MMALAADLPIVGQTGFCRVTCPPATAGYFAWGLFFDMFFWVGRTAAGSRGLPSRSSRPRPPYRQVGLRPAAAPRFAS